MIIFFKSLWRMINNPTKLIRNINNEPYFKMIIYLRDDDTTDIEPIYNSTFIYQLDQQYQGNPTYAQAQSDDDKIAIYMHDMTTGIFTSIFPNNSELYPEGELLDPENLDDIPAMSFRGGKEVRQVVDLGQPNPNDIGKYDIKT